MKSLRILLAVAFFASCAQAVVYHVGPGKAYTSIGSVPWESLGAGDSVLIYYRSTPYREKWVICAQGTALRPIVVRGIPDSRGVLPVIDGADAVTRPQLNFWSEARGVIKIGGASRPTDKMPSYINIERLDIKSARPPYYYTGSNGTRAAYARDASAIFLEKGEHIVVRNCILRDCGNGFFSAYQSADVLVEYCSIYDNGTVNNVYEHNNYTESAGITFQFNHFGLLRAGCTGTNLKDRSSGCVIRYNWIESGNRQIDLVDAGHSNINSLPEYRSAFVYGNILIETDNSGNNQVCHYGGDSNIPGQYRKGTLYFYNNTVVSTRSGTTTLVRLSTGSESCDMRNNVIYTTASGGNLALLEAAGTLTMQNNWIKSGWRKSHTTANTAQIVDKGNTITGENPGFLDYAAKNFRLLKESPGINRGCDLAGPATGYRVLFEYVKNSARIARISDGAIDLGAYETAQPMGVAKRVPGIAPLQGAQDKRADRVYTIQGRAISQPPADRHGRSPSKPGSGVYLTRDPAGRASRRASVPR